MTRNRVPRKRRSGSFVLAVAAAAAIGGAALLLMYLRLGWRCESLGREIQALEHEGADLRRRATAEEYKWSNRNSLREIRQALARLDIEMGWPEERRIVRLTRAIDAAAIGPAPQFVLQPSREGAQIP